MVGSENWTSPEPYGLREQKEKEPAGAPAKMECYKISAGTRQKEESVKNSFCVIYDFYTKINLQSIVFFFDI
jgi:hypothetical protein